jgi:hypothetical protein
MLSHMLIKVLRMAIDDLWVDSRHDVLTPGPVLCPDKWHGSAVLLNAGLLLACRPRGWPVRRLR